MTQNDAVKLIEGPNKGIRGTILHIYKDYLFLHSREFKETLGIFVEKARSVIILGSSMISDKNQNS